MARKIKGTTPPPMTLDERRNSAAAKAAAAVTVLTQAADDLDDAANELYAVEDEVREEMFRLEYLATQSRDEANERAEQAWNIRTLLPDNPQG